VPNCLPRPAPPCPALFQKCEKELGRGSKRSQKASSGGGSGDAAAGGVGGQPAVRVTHKLCRRCGQNKEAKLFYGSKHSLDGLYTYCKVRRLVVWLRVCEFRFQLGH
jgi:hypothetical protein